MLRPPRCSFKLNRSINVFEGKLFHSLSLSLSPSPRLRALRDMLESVSRVEDIVKVYEARLTEKETTSLSPSEVEDYMSALKVNVSCVYVCVHIYHTQPSGMISECFSNCKITVFFLFFLHFLLHHCTFKGHCAVQFETERIEVRAFCGLKNTLKKYPHN